MEVNNNVNVAVNVNNYNVNVNNTAAAEETDEAVLAAAQQDEQEVYEPSEEAKVYKPDYAKIKEIWAEHDAKVESFRRLVEGLFNKQAQKNGLANGSVNKPGASNPWAGTRWENDVMIEVDEETRLAAQKEVEEGGYYSVGETAKRLLNFAVALSGGDPSKIETLKGAVEKGFAQARQMWGGELPEISNKTYDEVMKGFDEWEASGDASAITLLNQK
jgi:hypothetical protein